MCLPGIDPSLTSFLLGRFSCRYFRRLCDPYSCMILVHQVNALAKVGNALANGSIGDASGKAREIDAGVSAALKALSINPSAASAADSTTSELNALLGALNSGDLAASKKEYVDTVLALTDWAIKANVELKGV